MRAATKLKVLCRRLTAIGEWHNVMDLQERTLAAAAECPDKRTTALVAPPYLALYRS